MFRWLPGIFAGIWTFNMLLQMMRTTCSPRLNSVFYCARGLHLPLQQPASLRHRRVPTEWSAITIGVDTGDQSVETVVIARRTTSRANQSAPGMFLSTAETHAGHVAAVVQRPLTHRLLAHEWGSSEPDRVRDKKSSATQRSSSAGVPVL
ncbi:hypothetical protein LZ31DRAFT_198214 [Colletotrichum somersetense]|nr:hypothetical protein LZ31DRAFT_198214 [Colletotrichum somersetense]